MARDIERCAQAERLGARAWEEAIPAAAGNSSALAWIEGAPASFDDAIGAAARRIGASVLPVFAHLGVDTEGAREAVLLAETAGGALDHAASAALLCDLDPIRQTGGFQTTPLEAAARADVVLLVGAADATLDWLARPHGADVARRVIRLAAAGQPPLVGAALLAYLAALRARVKQRPVAGAFPAIESEAAVLRDAKFGVAVWSAAQLAPLAVEALHGLARDLNETTRFSTLALAAPDNGLGVQAVCGWMTGFPLRTAFARGAPEHDPWRYDARRLIAAGETDCVIWASTLQGGAPPPEGVAIALCGAGAPPTALVHFLAARPGVESAAIVYDARVGALVARPAEAPAPTPTAAEIFSAIRARLAPSAC